MQNLNLGATSKDKNIMSLVLEIFGLLIVQYFDKKLETALAHFFVTIYSQKI